MSSLMSRVLVAVIGVPVLIWVVLWAPSVIITAAISILSCIAGYELLKCIGLPRKGELYGVTLLFAVLMPCLYGNVGFEESAASAFCVFYIIVLFFVAIRKAGEIKFSQITASIFAAILIPYAFSAFVRMEASGIHRVYLLLPFLLSFVCDTFAYMVGCSIGKHKLAPRVSPKKSVEGAVGGLVGNVLGGVLFVWIVNQWCGLTIGYGAMAALALACGVVAQVGDLSFSLIKREFGIKDYGSLFLAHGGVLDRFDSVLFVAPVIEVLLNLMK